MPMETHRILLLWLFLKTEVKDEGLM